MEEMG